MIRLAAAGAVQAAERQRRTDDGADAPAGIAGRVRLRVIDAAIHDEAVFAHRRVAQPRREGAVGLEVRRPLPAMVAGIGVDDAGQAVRPLDAGGHLAAHVGEVDPGARNAPLHAGVGIVELGISPAPAELGGLEVADVARLGQRLGRPTVERQGGQPAAVGGGGHGAQRGGLAALANLVHLRQGIVRLGGELGAALHRAGHAHQSRHHVVGGVRAVAGQRLAVVVAVHELAIADRVAHVVSGMAQAHRQRITPLRRQLFVGEVAPDLRRVFRLAVGAQHVFGRIPTARIVMDLRTHALHQLGVGYGLGAAGHGGREFGRVVILLLQRAGLDIARVILVLVDQAGPIEAVVLVAQQLVGARFQIQDQIDLGLTGAGGQQHLADAEGLQVDAQVLLDAGEGGGIVVVGHRHALALELGVDDGRLAGQLVLAREAKAAAVRQADDRHAHVALDAALRVAVGHRRVRMRQRPRRPIAAVVHGEVGGQRHLHTRPAGADLRPPAEHVVGQKAHQAFVLGKVGVFHDPRHALPGLAIIARGLRGVLRPVAADAAVIGNHLALVARVLGTADVALGKDQRRAQLAVDVALQRRQEVRGVQVVRLQALRVLAKVDPHRQRLGAGFGQFLKAHHHQAQIAVLQRVARRRAVGRRGQTHDVALVDVVGHGRRAHARRGQVGLGGQDGLGHLARLLFKKARVENILEDPHAPGGRRGIGRGMVVAGAVQNLLVADAGAGLGQDLRDAANQRVLRQVVIGFQQRDALAVAALDHDGARRQPRLHAVAGVLGRMRQVGVDVAPGQTVEEVGCVAVLAGAIAHIRRHVDDAHAGAHGRIGLVAQCHAHGIALQVGREPAGVGLAQVVERVVHGRGHAGLVVAQRRALGVVEQIVRGAVDGGGDRFGVAGGDGRGNGLGVGGGARDQAGQAVLAAGFGHPGGGLHRRADVVGRGQRGAIGVRSAGGKADFGRRVLDAAGHVVAHRGRGHQHEVVRAGVVEEPAGVVDRGLAERLGGLAQRVVGKVFRAAAQEQRAAGRHMVIALQRTHVADEVIGHAQVKQGLVATDPALLAQVTHRVGKLLARRRDEKQIADAEARHRRADDIAVEPGGRGGPLDAGVAVGELAARAAEGPADLGRQPHEGGMVGIEHRQRHQLVDEALGRVDAAAAHGHEGADAIGAARLAGVLRLAAGQIHEVFQPAARVLLAGEVARQRVGAAFLLELLPVRGGIVEVGTAQRAQRGHAHGAGPGLADAADTGRRRLVLGGREPARPVRRDRHVLADAVEHRGVGGIVGQRDDARAVRPARLEHAKLVIDPQVGVVVVQRGHHALRRARFRAAQPVAMHAGHMQLGRRQALRRLLRGAHHVRRQPLQVAGELRRIGRPAPDADGVGGVMRVIRLDEHMLQGHAQRQADTAPGLVQPRAIQQALRIGLVLVRGEQADGAGRHDGNLLAARLDDHRPREQPILPAAAVDAHAGRLAVAEDAVAAGAHRQLRCRVHLGRANTEVGGLRACRQHHRHQRRQRQQHRPQRALI